MSKLLLDKITKYVAAFKKQHGLTVVIGCELEFYVEDPKFLELLKIKLHPVKLEAEEGVNQFELQFLPSADVVGALNLIARTKRTLQATAKKFGTKVYFDAKPYDDQPGSGLHIHLNFLDRKGHNVFEKQGTDESVYLLYSVGGLLATIEESMKIFAPKKMSHKRFSGSMTSPSTISWGENNRTTALRIPPLEKGCRRIEHRVAGADANIFAAALAVLHGAHIGIKEKIKPQSKTYGNAFDEQYSLKKFTS